MISLLKYLKDETKAKFWITTRPHCKELLEDSLSVFALELQPMDDSEKKELVSKYLINRLEFTLIIREELISLYAEKFLHNVKNIFHNSKFIGSPLQLHLMLESATENFKNWAHSENHENHDFSYLGQNVLEIYSNYIHKKYEYFKKLKNEGNEYSLEEIQSICDLCHVKLAETLTLDSDPDVSLENFEGVNNALACGIVTSQNGRLIFIHSTFQEYYASKLFLNWIKETDRFSNYGKLEFIFKKVFLEADFEIIRLFLDCRFKDVKVGSLPSANIKTAFEIMQKLLKREDDNETFLEVAIQEHANVFYFVISLLLRRKMMNFFDIKCRFNDTVLIYACRCNKKRIVEVILEKCGEAFDGSQFFEYLCVRGQSKETCLHHSAFYSNTDILKLLFDKAKEVASSESEFQEFLNLKDDWENNILHLAASNLGKIFSAIIKGYKGKYFEESHQMAFVLLYRIRHKYLFPEIPYEMLYKHFWRVLHIPVTDAENDFELFSKLLQFKKTYGNQFNFTAYNAITLILEQHVSACEKRSMIHSKNLKGFDATHVAAAYGDMISAECLLSQINGPIMEPKKRDVSFDSRNYGQYCALNLAALEGHITVFRLLLENIHPDEIYKIFIMTNFQRCNILHVSAYLGRADILELLLKKVKDVRLENLKSFLVSKCDKGLNPLHLAVQEGHFRVVDMLLRQAAELSFELEYITSLNDENRNPIQTAAENDRREIFELMFDKIPAEKKEEILLNKDSMGFNALILAAARGSNGIIQFIYDRLKETTDIFETFWNCHAMDKCNILSWAAENGRFDTIRILLQLAEEISSDFEYEFLTSFNEKRHTAFFCAILESHSDIFKYMLDKIPEEKMYDFLNFSDDQGYNVLHHSAFFGNSDIVNLVLNKVKFTLKENFVEYLFRKGNNGTTPLHLAADRGHLNVVEILLQLTAEKSPALQYEYLRAPDGKKRNAIHLAVGMNNAEITTFLLKQIPPEKIYETFTIPEEKGINILHLSAHRGNVEILKKILNTIKESSLEKFERFLQSKCDGGFHSLQLAVQEGHRNVVQILLQYGSEISPEFHHLFLTSTNDNEENVIYTSIFKNRSEVTELLLNEIPTEIMYEILWQFNRNNFNSLLLSASSGYYNSIKLILDKLKQNSTQENFRAFLHSNNSNTGFNALHFAAQKGHFDALPILLRYASDFHYEFLTSIDRNKRNALHIAIITHHYDIASWLLNQIPEDLLSKTVSLTDIENGNILHYAAFRGQNDLVKTILEAKKGSIEDLKQLLSSQMINHGNPLHLAAYQGHLDITEILLQRAGEISPQFQYEYLNSVNGDRRNVLHVASLQNRSNVLAYLIHNIPKNKTYEILSALNGESCNVLHLLAYKGNNEVVELILNHLKLAVSVQTFTASLLSRGNGFNALHLGTDQGHIKVVKTLLKFAEDISAELLYEYLASLDTMKRSAIHIAIQYNHSDIAAYIIKKIPSDKILNIFNYCSALDYNILHHLSFTGNSDIITLVLQLLKEHSSEEDFKTFLFTQHNDGENALHIAAVNGHEGVVEILLYYAEEISPEFHYKYLTSTSSVEKRNAVQLSLLKKNDIAASLLEKLPTEQLLEVLSSCDLEGSTILHFLAYSGMTDGLKVILRKLINTPEKVFQEFSRPGKRDYNTLHIAAHQGHFDFVKLLFQYVAENLPPEFQYRYLTSVNDKKRNAIHNAIKKNNLDVAGWLLDKIPTEKIYEFVSFVDHKGFNILHHSAFIGSDKLVEQIFSKLKENTYSENIAELLSERTHEGHSAYTLALLQGHLNLSETILQFNNLLGKRSKQESSQ